LKKKGEKKANGHFRTKRRRDSGTVKDSLLDLAALLEEVETNVGLVVEEWLVKATDGQSFPPIKASTLLISLQPKRKAIMNIFARLIFLT
jgi:hypothetical protein